MADIFISYANEDRATAARVAAHLESVGWHVWWDRRIPAGRSWRAVLAEALLETRCMVILWSEHSVESPWVAEEAEEARRLRKALLPVMIQRVDPPIGFRTIQAANLSAWDGSADDPAIKQLVADLESLIGAPDRREAPPKPEAAPMSGSDTNGFFSRWSSVRGASAALGILVIIGLVAVWHNWRRSEPDVAVPVTLEEPRAEKIEARLTGLSVNAGRKVLEPAETLKLTATAKHSDGSAAKVTEGVDWSSSNPSVATIDGQGEVKALSGGTTKIIARLGGVESDAWSLRVAEPAARPPPNLVALSVSAGRRDLFEREKIVLRATGKYSDDSRRTVAQWIEWQISDKTIASVNADGELTALRPGKVEVVARADRVTSAPLVVNVKKTAPPAKPQDTPDNAQARAKIAAYLRRAETLREQGNYAAALAELEKGRAVDAGSEAIAREIEQTRRACNAEKLLGIDVEC